jgi:hypothetical protein
VSAFTKVGRPNPASPCIVDAQSQQKQTNYQTPHNSQKLSHSSRLRRYKSMQIFHDQQKYKPNPIFASSFGVPPKER